MRLPIQPADSLSFEAPIQRRPRKPFDWSTAFIATVVIGAAIAIYFRDGRERFTEILSGDFVLFVDILPKVLAACLIAAFVAVLMPREAVVRWVGAESGWTGLLIATVAGVICPGGPITIFPIASAFIAVGADIGATIAFITSWTLLGYARVLVWELPFFGIDFVIWRIVVALPLPMVAGALARLIANALAARSEDSP
jgi:uncharacterized membrane protein YraQ (UPF0718 family)